MAVDRVVTELDRDGSLSDQRFTDSYIYHRVQRGYGPLRIRQELLERGVSEEIISAAMEHGAIDWMACLAAVSAKKFGKSVPADFTERARQSRFLQYRGFTPDQIRRLFNQDS